MEKVKLGVIGCGVMGNQHVDEAQKTGLFDVVAVADVSEPAVSDTAKRFGVKNVFTDADGLLSNPEVEAVVLAMPTCSRTELVLKAFAGGKHVLTEKPVAMNAGEVKQMLAARGKLTAGCCSSRFRFLPSAEAASDFIACGKLGVLRAVRSKAFFPAGPKPEQLPPPWRLKKEMNGGGILVNWGCYDLDFLLGVTGWSLRPRRAYAMIWPIAPELQTYVVPGSTAETHFACLVTCDHNVSLILERGEYMSIRTESVWEITGTMGSLHLIMSPGKDKKIIFDEITEKEGVRSSVVWEGDDDFEKIRADLLLDFARAIQSRSQPKTSLDQSLVIQKITDAVYASAQQGMAVQIN